MGRVLSRAISDPDLLDASDTAVIFHDLTLLKERLDHLRAVFPPSTLHAVAVKANPLVNVLGLIEANGAGAEAASLPELHLALTAGFPPERIVYDSPVKTQAELAYALKRGVTVNADSIEELRRIDDLPANTQSPGTVGIRINPQVGAGVIASSSVAGEYSKFGVPLNEQRDELIQCFLKYDWLRGVHVHIGSQGCPLQLLVRGVERTAALVIDINRQLAAAGMDRSVEVIDIGGGLPVSHRPDETPPTMDECWQAIAPLLADVQPPPRRLITEFGRWVHANAGWVASRVETVKRSAGAKTVMTHVGADLFLRRCYRPEDWHHEVSVANGRGQIKSGRDEAKYMIAGPLCFAGDMIARNIELPPVDEGDWVLIHDAGAYTLSMWSRYNSRQVPKVIGYYDDGERFELLKPRETIYEVIDFWR